MELAGVELKTVDVYEKDSQTTLLTVTCSETPLTLYQYSLPSFPRLHKSSLLHELHRLTDFLHPHIARIYKVWPAKDKLFVLQEKIGGDSLGQVMGM